MPVAAGELFAVALRSEECVTYRNQSMPVDSRRIDLLLFSLLPELEAPARFSRPAVPNIFMPAILSRTLSHVAASLPRLVWQPAPRASSAGSMPRLPAPRLSIAIEYRPVLGEIVSELVSA